MQSASNLTIELRDVKGERDDLKAGNLVLKRQVEELGADLRDIEGKYT